MLAYETEITLKVQLIREQTTKSETFLYLHILFSYKTVKSCNKCLENIILKLFIFIFVQQIVKCLYFF